MSPPDEVTARLRKSIEPQLRDGHPWIYRDALHEALAPGALVRVVDSAGRFVARGIADEGALAVRVFCTRDEALDDKLFDSRLARAAQLRRRVVSADTTAFRLVHGEGDRLPGFVCDVYDAHAVLKCDGEGAHLWHERFAARLRPLLEARGVHTLLYRSPASRALRGTPLARAALLWGAPPEGPLTVREHGMALTVDLLLGQKTGLFLDQRESRLRVRALARGLRVLNLYGYTGGFSVAAGLGGASAVTTVDVAPGALEMARQSWSANELAPALHRTEVADVPSFLAAAARERERYDLVIADPPSFAPSAEALERALQSYRALHTACLGLLAPGGYYLAGSCSSHVDQGMFRDTVLASARSARRVLQGLDAWGAPPDHPTLPAFPEGGYLKVLLYRVE